MMLWHDGHSTALFGFVLESPVWEVPLRNGLCKGAWLHSTEACKIPPKLLSMAQPVQVTVRDTQRHNLQPVLCLVSFYSFLSIFKSNWLKARMKGWSHKESHTELLVSRGSGCSCHWETPAEEDKKRAKGDRQQDTSDVTGKMENEGY